MKKLMNKSFWIILIISIITLVALTIGVVSLTKKSEKEFYSAGYIINSTASKTDKYYFNDNTKYKENVFNEYVFKDTDNKEVSSSKNNFIHYSDKSLSFMKNGVILDLDNFNEKLVPYYNITDKSIIKYNNGNYNIETADKTLVFHNFLGRITDNKYIVVGKDIRIKLAGNEKTVSGNYFELMFVEDGIVKIENEEGSYQVVTEGTTISVGSNIKIDLGDKSVSYGNETKLSLDEMTIDGNENIDIKPTGKVKTEEEQKNNENGSDNSNNNNDNNNDNTASNNNIENKNGEISNKTVLKKELSIDLINAKVDVNNIYAEFQVIDTGNYTNGNLVLTLENITKKEKNATKEIVVNAGEIQEINLSDLSPNCNYLMTITSQNDISETQYFRRVFKTQTLNDINVKLEMAGTNSLEYMVEFNNQNIKSGIVNLTSENGSVSKTVINQGDYSYVTFDNLKENTKYNITLNNVVYSNGGTADISYKGDFYTGSNMTLKRTPTINNIYVNVDEEQKIAKLVVETPDDPDNSITKYTYKVYKNVTIEEEKKHELVYQFDKMRNQLETKTIEKDDVKYEVIGKNEEKLAVNNKNIFSDIEYSYSVVMEYYDNYKYGEIETSLSNPFIIPKNDTVKLTFVPEKVDYNTIRGTIKIKDSDCIIPNIGRECNDRENNYIIKYISSTSNNTNFIKNAEFTEKKEGSDELEYNLNLTNLSKNTTYSFEVYANSYSNGELVVGKYIGSFIVSTGDTETLKMQNWNQNNYSFDVPISVSTEITSTVVESNKVEELSYITYKLYKGEKTQGNPIATFTASGDDIIKNQLFDITSKDFGIENLDMLKELSGGKLAEHYTIVATDAYDEGKINEFTIENNVFVYNTPPLLILENEVSDSKIIVDPITNKQSKEYGLNYHKSNLDSDTIVAYKVTASIDIKKISSRYDSKKINFYAYNSLGTLIQTKNIDIEYDENEEAINTYTTYFELNAGTDYDKKDTDTLRRGNEYIFAFDISIDTDNDEKVDTYFPTGKKRSNIQYAYKKDPTLKMYIDKSTSSSVTYKFDIFDVDKAFYQEDGKYYIYYKIGDSEENKVEIINNEFTISNLTNDSVYSISYERANDKMIPPVKVKSNDAYFDGSYNIDNYTYSLNYSDYDNRLKIVLDENELSNRVTAYKVNLTSGNDKYTKVVSQNNLEDCNDKKCIVVDYADIATFKGKKITTSVEAFYDTGYVGFSMESKLNKYFSDLGLVDENKYSKAGYLFQDTGINSPGNYIYLGRKPNSKSLSIQSSANPNGIMAYELIKNNGKYALNISNLFDESNNNFVNAGTISKDNYEISYLSGAKKGLGDSDLNYSYNPKVLDKIELESNDNEFTFTSIIPKVTTTVEPIINGGIINIDLSIDPNTLENDYIKTDGKYKFYIDIYTCKGENCSEEMNYLTTKETDYDNLNNVIIDGLTPNELTTYEKYCFKISADMNKNNKKVTTPLFNFNKKGYVEYVGELTTLPSNKIFNNIKYENSAASDIENKIYSTRNLKTELLLNTKTNFDVKFEIYDNNNNNKEYTFLIPNEKLLESEGYIQYNQDISDNSFIFGKNSHSIRVVAITNNNKSEPDELELYNELLEDDGQYKRFKELDKLEFIIESQANIEYENNEYKYGIDANITVSDKSKVMKNGKFTIELQEPSSQGYVNACPDNKEACKTTIDYFNGGFNNINIKFTDLKSDTSYIIYIYADSYRNNSNLSEIDKTKAVEIRKTQYTQSPLGFSLGLVTPTAESDKKLVITFTGSSNLINSITGIDYSINIQGGVTVASGTMGKTLTSDGDNIKFNLQKNEEPKLIINMPESTFKKNNYIINIKYYYKNSAGDIDILNINENTNYSYGIIYNDK